MDDTPDADDEVVRRVAREEGGELVARVKGRDLDRVRDDESGHAFLDRDNFAEGDGVLCEGEVEP